MFSKNNSKIFKFFSENSNLNSLLIPHIKSSEFVLKKKMSNKFGQQSFQQVVFLLEENFLRFLLKNNIYKVIFCILEIDARLVIFSKFYMGEYNILNKKLTFYNFDKYGITADINKFSKKWWLRRSEAFKYLMNIKKKNMKHLI